NPKPQTPNPNPQSPNPKPQTPNPKPQTPIPKPQTPNPKPQPERSSLALASTPLSPSAQNPQWEAQAGAQPSPNLVLAATTRNTTTNISNQTLLTFGMFPCNN
ncbi:hypothetical protein T484DRAFT_1631146, partial [Baffinella frigidus]